MAILEYRNSPIDDTGLSPAQMFLGRRLKTRLPTATALLKPQHTDEIRKSLKQRQLKQKYIYDKHAGKTDLKPLQAGENVVMRHRNNWKHGTVEREHESPRSYVIQTPDGRKYRRNYRQCMIRICFLTAAYLGQKRYFFNFQGYETHYPLP